MTSRPRILIGVTSDQTCIVLRGRLHALREAGFDVTVVCSPGRWLTSVAASEGVDAISIPMRREIAPWADAVALLRLCWIIAKLRPAITDFSTPKCGLLGNAAAWLLRVPQRIYTLRGLRLESSRGLQKLLLLWAERLSAWCAHTVLCNSESLRLKTLEYRVTSQHKVVMLGEGSTNGVNTSRFSSGKTYVRELLNIPSDGPVIAYVGRLTQHKGIPELMAAFQEILKQEPDCWLMLVGWFDQSEDALDKELRAEMENHPRVLLVGAVEDPVPYYRAMDLFVLPTHREGFPNVALEAAACGVPVITTSATGARDAVEHGITGLLVPKGKPSAIADAVLCLLRDKERRLRMSAAAQEWVIRKYDQRRVLSLAVEFYISLLNGNGFVQVKELRAQDASVDPANVSGKIREIG